MPLLDASGRPVPAADIARARAQALADPNGGPSPFATAYDGAQRSGTWLSNWTSGLRSPDRDWLPVRDSVVARARDLARNDPIAVAAINRRKNSAVGRGWRLTSKPNARALGIPIEAAQELGAQIQSAFRLYAYGHAFQSDAERRLTFGQQLRLAVNHLMGADGEALGVVEWAADEPTDFKTRLRIVDPDRLSNPSGRMNDALMRGGVEHSSAGAPIRYWLREQHPADFPSVGSWAWTGFDRWTAWGRPQVLHVFEPERAGQSRGVSKFVSALKSFRALSKFTDATLQNATINALMVAFVKSDAGPQAVSDNLSVDDLKGFEGARESFYQDHAIAMGDDARIPVLPFGDEIKMATADRDVTSFDTFTRSIIRLIASSLGETYEAVSMDFSQTNYSSARAALLLSAAEVDSTQGLVEAQLANPFYVAWLEEAFDRGVVTVPAGAPDFYDAIDAYAECRWIGPKRGYIDPTKEILAAAARIEAGVSTLEIECADQGLDYEDVIAQLAREQKMRVAAGLQPTGVAEAQAIADTKNPAKGASDPTNDQGVPLTPEDARPGASGALARIASFAETAEHMASLDGRPVHA